MGLSEMGEKKEKGTVRFFNNNPDKRFGFIEPDVGDDDIFFHHNGARHPQRPIHGFIEPGLISTGGVRFPQQGDRVVYESELSPKGRRAKFWAFEQDYERAKLAAGIPSNYAGTPQLLDELNVVAGGILWLGHNIRVAAATLELSDQQTSIFLQNTPSGKKGDELCKEFWRRQADNGGEGEYTFITFVREVMKNAGHPVTFKMEGKS